MRETRKDETPSAKDLLAHARYERVAHSIVVTLLGTRYVNTKHEKLDAITDLLRDVFTFTDSLAVSPSGAREEGSVRGALDNAMEAVLAEHSSNGKTPEQMTGQEFFQRQGMEAMEEAVRSALLRATPLAAETGQGFDPSLNCPIHFALGDPSCPACISKQSAAPTPRPAETGNAGLTHSGPCAACGQTIPATPAETAPVAWESPTEEELEMLKALAHNWAIDLNRVKPLMLSLHKKLTYVIASPSPSAEPTEEQVEAMLATGRILAVKRVCLSPDGTDIEYEVMDARSITHTSSILAEAVRAALRASGGR